LGFALVAFVAGSIADRTSLRVPFLLQAALMAVAFLLSLGVQEAPRRDQPRASTGKEASDQPGAITEQRLSIAPLLIAGVILSLCMSAIQSVWANYMVNDHGYTSTMVARLWSLTALSEVPFLIATGWLSDRVGRLPMLSLGLLGWVFVALGYAFVPMYPWIWVVQLIRGFAFAAFTATSMVYIAEASTRQERGRTAGVYSSTRGVGSIVGASLGGLLTQRMGYAPMLSICAGLLFTGALYLAITHVSWRRMGRGASGGPLPRPGGTG